MDRVDIVIPSFNAERTLPAALDSAVAQDGVGAVVVVDDGSTDGSLAVARGYGPSVTILSGPNRGVAAARNRGVAVSDSEWIVFLDADDVLMPGTIRRRLTAALQTRADVVISDWEEVDDDGRGFSPSGRRRAAAWDALRADPELATATSFWATTAAILYRRRLVERVGGFRGDVTPIEDARHLFDAAHRGGRFAASQHVGAIYRVMPGSLSRADPAKFWRSVLRNGMQIEELWRNAQAFGAARQKAISEVYNNAARALFQIEDESYFEAIAAQHRLALPLPRHTRLAGPLARLIGLRAANKALALMGRP